MKLIKNNKDTDFTPTVESTFNLLNWMYGSYSIRVNNIFQLIKSSYGIDEFEIFDPRYCNNGVLESYLIDKQIDWIEGKDVNFEEIYNKLLELGDFSKSERIIFENGNIEERLWAIYLLACNPGIDNLNNLKNNN